MKEAAPDRMVIGAPFLTLAFVAALVGGCAVGPNFKTPPPPQVNRYTAAQVQTNLAGTDVAGGESQHLVQGLDIPAEWWTVFHSPELNTLITASLTNNPDLAAAQAALRVAHENMLAQRGAFFPSISADFSATRQKQSSLLAPVPNFPTVSSEFQYNLFTPEVNVSYMPDVFGLNRRTVESLRAQEQGVKFQLVATYLTLSANVVVAAIQEATLREQIAATRDLININSNMVDILRYQFTNGYAGGLDLAAQESQLAQVAATLPPLIKQLAQQRNALAVLAGRFPSDDVAEKFVLTNLTLPQDLPLSLPSQLVAQRPDVRQAEANFHAATAQIGVAIANRLPNITLTANAGSSALAIDQVFTSGTGFWGLGAQAMAPIFQGGTLLHQERAAKAAAMESAEQYRSTVLTAFQNVADTLVALEQDAEALKTAAAAATAAKVTLDLTQEQIQTGYASYLALLSAEQSYQQARLNLVQAQAGRFADTAALFQALGGGWWHRADFTEDKK